MDRFVRIGGVAAPLLRPNIDTDQITPGRSMMSMERVGSGGSLFANWRFHEDGSENPDFVLNRPRFRDASFLVAGENFGCGSSREFAVWALRDFGIRAIIAPSFGAIFTANCFMNGLLPVILPEEQVTAIAAAITPDAAEIEVDLERQVVCATDGAEYGFAVPAREREMLLQGLDAVSLTLQRDAQITGFQERDRAVRPWVYNVHGAHDADTQPS